MEFYSTPRPERIENIEEAVLSSVETRAEIGTRRLAFEHRGKAKYDFDKNKITTTVSVSV
jgi:hypothetical protein